MAWTAVAIPFRLKTNRVPMFIFAIALAFISLTATIVAYEQNSLVWTLVFAIVFVLAILWFILDIFRMFQSHEYKYEHAERVRLRKEYRRRSPKQTWLDYRAGKHANEEHEHKHMRNREQAESLARQRREEAARARNS